MAKTALNRILHRFRGALVAFSCAVALFGSARAEELRPFYRSTVAQGMGGASIAIADPSEAGFLNPAALAGNKEVSWTYLHLDLEGSSDFYSAYQTDRQAFKSFNKDSLNAAMGYDFYARGTYTSTILLKHLSLSVISDAQAYLKEQNSALPQIFLGDQTTNGLQAAYGFSLMGNNRVRPGDEDLRVGVATKFLFRRGGYYRIPDDTMLRIEEGKALLNDIIGDYGTGFGVDLGTQYVHPITRSWTLLAGAVWHDIGDTTFSSPQASPITQNIGIGFGSKHDFGLVKVTAAYDYQNMTDPADWRARNHFGLAFQFPLLSVYGGINQAYFTYGLGFNLWLIRFNIVSYGEETGTDVHQDPTRRYILQLSMKLDF